jgi:protein AroM
MKTIGIVTIGQGPRTDVLKDLKPFFGGRVRLLERGALDLLTLEEVEKYSPSAGMTALVTRMNDGRSVVVAKEKILTRLEQAVDALNMEKVSLILLLCVGSFPSFESSCLIVEPQRVLDRCVAGLVGEQHHLGIMIPIPEQETLARDNFLPVTRQITVTVASPYSDRNGVSLAGHELKKAGCDLILMYCMGYTRESADQVRSATGKPVILANSLVARIVGELLDEGG